jgi:aldehyde:ferredoxin oxidoreductase
MPDFGYAGKILRINLSNGVTDTLDTSLYAGRFLGGRGMAAKLYWDETAADTGALEPGNCLIYITGPLAGFTRFAGCRWQICGKSAAMDPESFSYANLGGSWGAWLKYAGYDGLVVKGKAERPSFVLITGDKVEIRSAASLWNKTNHHTEELLHDEFGKDARILSIGPAGENMVAFATVLAAENSSGSSGFGAVMGSKNLKAIAIKLERKTRPEAADPEKLNTLAQQVYELRTKNYEDYEHILPLKMKNKACYGCISGCTRGYYEDENGREFKSQCAAAGVYMGPSFRYYGGMNDESMKAGRLANRLCDEYGLDTVVVAPMLQWLHRCNREGILTDENTGMSLSELGSAGFFREFARKVSFREGFGNVLADGTLKAAECVGKDSITLTHGIILTRGSESFDYDPRLILAHAILYATEPRRAIQLLHAITMPLSRWTNWRQGWKDAYISTDIFRDIAGRYWGSPETGNLASFEDKALAAMTIQDYGYVKESMILCDLAWPIWQVRDIDDAIVNATLESRILSAITGRDIDEKGLMKTGERIVNMQRAVLMRQGWGGRQGDTLFDYIFKEPLGFVFVAPESEVPGKGGNITSKKGNTLSRNEFEKLKDEYYALRCWDVESGMQTEECLQNLDMPDIAAELKRSGLLSCNNK